MSSLERPGMVLRAALLMVALALWLYPPRFRRRFGTEMREVFRERMQHEAMGVGAASRILLVTLADLTASAAKEWCRPLGGRSRQRTTTRGGREMGAMGHDAPRSKVVAAFGAYSLNHKSGTVNWRTMSQTIPAQVGILPSCGIPRSAPR